MKKLFICIGILLSSIFVIWGICEFNGRNHYDYHGYITNIYENENGETVIETLSGTESSVFTIKWYSKTSEPTFIGERIMLSTTLFSDKNIKKAKSTVGYFTEGTMIYAGGMPFVLIRLENTNTKHLINIIPSSTDLLNGIKTGDTVKLYHSSAVPLTAAPTLVADGVVIIDKEAHTSLSEEDIAFIQSQGYSIDN